MVDACTLSTVSAEILPLLLLHKAVPERDIVGKSESLREEVPSVWNLSAKTVSVIEGEDILDHSSQ